MSNNATLVERLRTGLVAVAAFVRGNADAKARVHDALDAVEEAAARIAELEAERDAAWQKFEARIAELEATLIEAKDELVRLYTVDGTTFISSTILDNIETALRARPAP